MENIPNPRDPRVPVHKPIENLGTYLVFTEKLLIEYCF